MVSGYKEINEIGGIKLSLSRAVNMLVHEIRSTKEFQELKKSKTMLSKHRDLYREFESLQKKQMSLLNSNISSREKERKIMELSKEFERLSRNPEIGDMVNAGDKFNKMMNKVYQDLGKLLDSEL